MGRDNTMQIIAGSLLILLLLAGVLVTAGCSSSYVPSAEARADHELRLNDDFHRMNGPAGVREPRYPHNFLP